MSGWMIEALIASTVLMLVVLALREPVSRRFGPRITYALWLLPALRMVLPPLPENWATAHVAPVAKVSVLIGQAAPVVQNSGTTWVLAFAAVWAIGSLAFLGWHMASYRRFASLVRQDCAPLCAHDAFTVQASRIVRSPLAFGVVRKMVVVPADFADRYDPAEQLFALEHEVAHHRRGDLIANLVGLAVLALHWFNPVAHMAWRAFRLDQEAACDALVLCDASPADRHAYGSALVKSATGGVPLAACTMTAQTGLKTRLRRIVEGRLPPMPGGAALAALLVIGGLAVTASTGLAARATGPAPMLALAKITPVPPVAPMVPMVPASTVVSRESPPAPPAAPAPPNRPASPALASADDVDGALGADLSNVVQAMEERRRDEEEAQSEIDRAQAAAGPMAHARPVGLTQSSAFPARCGEGTKLSNVAQAIVMPDGPTRIIHVAVCAPDAKATRLMVTRAIAQVRAQIAGDPTIPADLRQTILMSLDRQADDVTAHLPLS